MACRMTKLHAPQMRRMFRLAAESTSLWVEKLMTVCFCGQVGPKAMQRREFPLSYMLCTECAHTHAHTHTQTKGAALPRHVRTEASIPAVTAFPACVSKDRVGARHVRHQSSVVRAVATSPLGTLSKLSPAINAQAAAARRGLPPRPSVAAKRRARRSVRWLVWRGPDARLTVTSVAVAVVHQSRGPVTESHNCMAFLSQC